MVNKYNERVTITLNKTLLKDLRRVCKSNHSQFSKFIGVLLRNALHEYKMQQLERTPIRDANLAELIRIAKTNWLDDDTNE